jgi:hypothetical protein
VWERAAGCEGEEVAEVKWHFCGRWLACFVACIRRVDVWGKVTQIQTKCDEVKFV